MIVPPRSAALKSSYMRAFTTTGYWCRMMTKQRVNVSQKLTVRSPRSLVPGAFPERRSGYVFLEAFPRVKKQEFHVRKSSGSLTKMGQQNGSNFEIKFWQEILRLNVVHSCAKLAYKQTIDYLLYFVVYSEVWNTCNHSDFLIFFKKRKRPHK